MNRYIFDRFWHSQYYVLNIAKSMPDVEGGSVRLRNMFVDKELCILS